MKVSWFHKFGGPEVLVCEETRKPTPGAGEAVVRVRAVGINHVDLDVRAGTSRIALSFPHILGREFAGEVAAIPVGLRQQRGCSSQAVEGHRRLRVDHGQLNLRLHGPYSEPVDDVEQAI